MALGNFATEFTNWKIKRISEFGKRSISSITIIIFCFCSRSRFIIISRCLVKSLSFKILFDNNNLLTASIELKASLRVLN